MLSELATMPKARLRQSDIIAWAKSHHRRYDHLPTCAMGKVRGAPGETWASINHALIRGNRGLPGGSSLAKLFDKAFPRKVRQQKPKHTVAKILGWARAHYRRHGRYPSTYTGKVEDAFGESWDAINHALKHGLRGLPAGSTLARLFDKTFGENRRQFKPLITIQQVAEWAKAQHKRTGRWPSSLSGKVFDAPEESWKRIDRALAEGTRGFPGGTTLSKLLEQHVGKRPGRQATGLTESQILGWADAHFNRYGRWPTSNSGEIVGIPNENWSAISAALKHGSRGLSPGRSLSNLLFEHREVIHHVTSSGRLTARKILQWADEHHRQTGQWPRPESGRIFEPPYISWATIATRLCRGTCEVPKGMSLARLLQKERGASFQVILTTKLSTSDIVKWAKRHRAETGSWPNSRSGAVKGAPDEIWVNIESALKKGSRGLSGNDTLARFLERHVGRRIGHQLPLLTDDEILMWAKRHHQTHGRWPTCDGGAVDGAPKERWGTIDKALRVGARGLKRGRSLSKLLDTIRGSDSDGRRKRSLKLNDVALWARAYHRRMGEWPDRYCGRIDDARGETWFGIDEAMQNGWRGLKDATSLRSFFLRLKKPKALKTRSKSH